MAAVDVYPYLSAGRKLLTRFSPTRTLDGDPRLRRPNRVMGLLLVYSSGGDTSNTIIIIIEVQTTTTFYKQNNE